MHSAVLTEAGGVLTFGDNIHGQHGHGDQVTRLVPTAVAALAGEAAVEVATGAHHTVVRLAGGGLRAFGDNEHDQLGTGAVGGQVPLPTPVALPPVPPA